MTCCSHSLNSPPEGFATPLATFKRQQVSRRKRLWLAAALSAAVPLGATVGYWLVRGQPETVKLRLLGFTSGILITVVVSHLLAVEHARRTNKKGASLDAPANNHEQS